MRWRHWVLTISSLALVAGCAAPQGDFCDIARPMYFEQDGVVDWLADNDPSLLRGIVTNNDTVAKCP